MWNKSLAGFVLGSMLIGVLVASCGEPVNPAQEVRLEEVKPADTIHTARTALDYWGTYKGVLPCADCEGIETVITLDSANLYTLNTKYLGKKDSAGYNLKGSWKWADGSIIELQVMNNAPAKYFVGENKLIQLDMEGKRIEGALADKYVLNKQQ